MNMYESQTLRTSWNNCFSDYFKCANGVKQGGILSPLLFTIYVDQLIHDLQQDGTGCRIGSHYVGVAAYADDFVLLSPTRQGLQRMISICEQFGAKCHVAFNPQKTVCIRMSRNWQEFKVTLNGDDIQCVKHVKHLGQILSHDLRENLEIENKRSDLTTRFNYIMATYKPISSDVKYGLFDSFCLHLYGAATWILEDKNINSILTAWNICVRKIWGLSRLTHRALLPEIAKCIPVERQIWARFAGLLTMCRNGHNELMSQISEIMLKDQLSVTCRNVNFIARKSGVSAESVLRNGCITVPRYSADRATMVDGTAIRDCVLAIQNVQTIKTFRKYELSQLTDYLCIL